MEQQVLKERTFGARLQALPELVDFIDEAGGATGVTPDDRFRLTLMVEELFVNTVTHGHGGDCDAPVRLALEVEPASLTLVYEDTAPPYNPFAEVKTPGDETVPVEARPIGGLGIHLIVTMADRVGYSYAGGWNQIRVQLTPMPATD